MDAMVTARVPVEIKEQGNAILREIGSSPSKLVNAAYDYLLKTHSVPEVKVGSAAFCGKKRTLTEEQKAELKERMRKMTLKPSADWDDRPFKELLAEARDERYARFY